MPDTPGEFRKKLRRVGDARGALASALRKNVPILDEAASPRDTKIEAAMHEQLALALVWRPFA